MDDFLAPAIVADCAPCGVYPAVHRGLRDDASLPHNINDLVLADDPIPILDQQAQQIEHLWLDVHRRVPATQLKQQRIEMISAELKDHATGRFQIRSRKPVRC